MLKLFRKIRYELMEKNNSGKPASRTGRYFKYAVGEIVLVVIGILIALSINNWNEERKKEVQGKEYTVEIYRDLKKDISRIDGILDKLEVNRITSRRILEILENQRIIIEDSTLFSSDALNSSSVINVERQNNTWDELTSTGKIPMIDNDSLDMLLKDFYEYYDKQITQFSETPAKMRERTRNILGQCLDISSIDRYWKEDGDKTLSKHWFSCYLNHPDAKNNLNAIHASSYWQINSFREIKATAQSIMNYMEENIVS